MSCLITTHDYATCTSSFATAVLAHSTQLLDPFTAACTASHNATLLYTATMTATITTTTAAAAALTTEFTLAIEHNSKVAPYYLGRGRCSYYTGQHSAAFTDFAAALALDPGSSEAQSMLAHFDTEGNAAAAIATARRCVCMCVCVHCCCVIVLH
jgi:hypothetical protein